MEIVIKLDDFIGALFYYGRDITEIPANKVSEILDMITEVIHKANRPYKIIYNIKDLLDKNDMILDGNIEENNTLDNLKYVLCSSDKKLLEPYVIKLDDDVCNLISKLDINYIINGNKKTRNKSENMNVKIDKRYIYPYLGKKSIRNVKEGMLSYQIERYSTPEETYIEFVLRTNENISWLKRELELQEQQLESENVEAEMKNPGYSFDMCTFNDDENNVKRRTRKLKDK